MALLFIVVRVQVMSRRIIIFIIFVQLANNSDHALPLSFFGVDIIEVIDPNLILCGPRDYMLTFLHLGLFVANDRDY